MKTDPTNLTPVELSLRWNVPLATLSRWRWTGTGPKFTKLGKHISYRLRDIEIFEKQKLRRDTTCAAYDVDFEALYQKEMI